MPTMTYFILPLTFEVAGAATVAAADAGVVVAAGVAADIYI